MHREREQGGGRCRDCGPSRRLVERTHEEIGCKRTRECEERIHPAERPVDQKQLRRGGETDRDEPRTATRDAPREVVTERHGRECEQDRDPPHRLRRRDRWPTQCGRGESEAGRRRGRARRCAGGRRAAATRSGPRPPRPRGRACRPRRARGVQAGTPSPRRLRVQVPGRACAARDVRSQPCS